jgi:hypothetical protein
VKTNYSNSMPLMLSLLVLIGFCAGCATQVTVNSNPPGADIYARGSGRPAYRWEYRGKAPAEFKSYYSAVKTVAKWPDGKQSEVIRAKTGWTKSVELMLEPSATALPLKDIPEAAAE